MTKDEFVGQVRTWGSRGSSLVDERAIELVEGMGSHDPKLGALFRRLWESQLAIREYCARKLELKDK